MTEANPTPNHMSKLMINALAQSEIFPQKVKKKKMVKKSFLG